MVSLFYQKNIIEKPKLTLLLLFVFLVGFGFFSKDFKLDASSDTLLLENAAELIDKRRAAPPKKRRRKKMK